MAINNFTCDLCSKEEVCKVRDVLFKFHDDAKTQLCVDITIDACKYFEKFDEEK
jgi:hypothetical protein